MAQPLLLEGSRGPDVTNIQRALNYHLPEAMPALKLDGIFGARTKARLIQFQKLYDLKPDGVVGTKTKPALLTFVGISHHLLPQTYPAGQASMRLGLGIGDSAPQPSLLPPMPRLQLSFPKPFSLPPHLRPPILQFKPDFLKFLASRHFEIAAGTKMVFQKGQGEGEVFLDVQAAIWSRPFGSHVDTSLATGVGFETRIRDGHTETSLVVLAKVEVHDIFKIGPVDVAKLQVEAGLKGTDGKPVDLTATAKLGPSIETKNKRFSFGIGGYMDYSFNGREHEIKGGVFIDGTVHF